MYNLTGIYQSMRNEGLFFGIGGILIIIASLPLKKKKNDRFIIWSIMYNSINKYCDILYICNHTSPN